MSKMKFSEIKEEFDKIQNDAVADENMETYEDKTDWSKCGKLQVLGLTTEKYLQDCYNRGKKNTSEAEAHHLVVKDTKTQDTYVIHLSDSKFGSYYGDVNSQGVISIEKAAEKDFNFTHVPAENTFLDGFVIDSETLRYKQQITYQTDEKGNLKRDTKGKFLKDTDYFDNDTINGVLDDNIYYRGHFVKNNVFTYSQIGYDKGHDDENAAGYVKINTDLFKPLKTDKEKHNVWVVEAKSAKDAEHLASQLPGFTVFDATSADKLPDKIAADVVVIGGQSKFDTRDVTRRLANQPNVSMSYIPASQIAKFIAKQQALNPDRHNYTNYINTPKIREAFKRVEQHLKSTTAPEKKHDTKSAVPPIAASIVKDKKGKQDTL